MDGHYEFTAGSSNWEHRHHGSHNPSRQQVLPSPRGDLALLPRGPEMPTTYPSLPPGPASRAYPPMRHHSQAVPQSSAHVYPPPGPSLPLQHMRHSPPQHHAFYHGEEAYLPRVPSLSQYEHALMHTQAQPYGPYTTDTYPLSPPTMEAHPHLIQSSTPSQDIHADPLVPTYHGLIKTSTDAILLLAACDLPAEGRNPSDEDEESETLMQPSPPPRRIHRRLLEHERSKLIRPGSVFVWDEEEAGMRRWTDGHCWSASRVSGCFLTYRELELRKRAATDSECARANQYKLEGLIKQSFSMTSTSGRKLHIVSYYTKRDLRHGTLRRVSEDPRFVGEAGGEWGLSVDETEYPDPVTAAQDQASNGTAPKVVGRDNNSTADAGSPRTGTAPSSPRDPLSGSLDLRRSDGGAQPPAQSGGPSKRPSGPPPPPLIRKSAQTNGLPTLRGVERTSMQYSSTTSARRPSYHEESDSTNNLSVQLDTRPPLKRKRSSSAGEIYRRVSSSTGASMHGRLSDGQVAGTSGTQLTESNVRGANLAGSSMSRRFMQPDVLTPSTYTEQDSAVGALLSLRGSLNEQASTSNPTPLTTPDDADSKERVSIKKQPSGDGSTDVAASTPPTSISTSSDRPKAPKRLPSDRDALNKLSVRL